MAVVASIWPLFLGMTLIMVGNGMQASLMGVRGVIEGFGTLELSLVVSGYFMGFLVGSRIAPVLIRRVGHVRVFAALASLVSAGLIAFPILPHPLSWTLIRMVIGFCLSGVYVTVESWLNNQATNQTRGQILSFYMVVQVAGLITAQGMMNLTDASGYSLFVIPSILVSLSFAPILLSMAPVPPFDSTKPMGLRQLYGRSPLASIGMVFVGGVSAAQFGMASVYGATAGLSLPAITTFVAAIFAGSMAFQFPVGWLSDRIDRARLVRVLAVAGAVATATAFFAEESLVVLVLVAFLVGGAASPLYALFIAHANDSLSGEDMAAASGGLVFAYGVGAVVGPMATGPMMDLAGPRGFWALLWVVFVALAVYTSWCMWRSQTLQAGKTAGYVGVLPTSSSVAIEAAQEWYAGHAESGVDGADQGA